MSLEPENGLCDVSLSFHFHIFRIALVYLILRNVEYYGDSQSKFPSFNRNHKCFNSFS